MKKTFFVLLIVFVCIVPGSVPSAHQHLNKVDSKGVKQLAESPLTSSDQIVLLAPPALASNSPAAAGKSRNIQLKRHPLLKGYTTGNPNIDAYIIASAARNNVDPVLVYSVMHQESDFKPHAVSRKGARGLMQVIPATATRFGVRNVFNPQQNIEAGARYLRFLLDTFEGDVSLALAGYNAGENNVKKYMMQIPPFPETIRYVIEVKQRYEAINRAPLTQIPERSAEASRRNG